MTDAQLEALNVIEFTNWILKIDLYPAQETILRCLYGLALDAGQLEIYRTLTGNENEFESGQEKVEAILVLECDRRCRNHIFTATDLCVLPNLPRVAAAGIAALRIEGQLDSPSAVAVITGIYRKAIDSLRAGEMPDIAGGLEKIRNATGRELSDGPFDFQAAPAETKERDFVTARTNRA